MYQNEDKSFKIFCWNLQLRGKVTSSIADFRPEPKIECRFPKYFGIREHVSYPLY